MAEKIPHWKQEMLKAQREKDLKEQFPELGKIVKYEGEYGLVVHEDFVAEQTNEDASELGPLYIRWDTDKEFDFEQHGFFDVEFIDNYEFSFINKDGTYPRVNEG